MSVVACMGLGVIVVVGLSKGLSLGVGVGVGADVGLCVGVWLGVVRVWVWVCLQVLVW